MKHIFTAITLAILSFSSTAHAAIEKDGHRFSLSGGLVYVSNNASFAVSAEYEYRMEPLYGVGAQASYVFSTLAFTQIAAPIFFLHPLEGDWYVSASPVFYLGAGTSLVGARFMTRMPLNMDVLMLTPTFGVDIIKGGPNYILGLGIAI